MPKAVIFDCEGVLVDSEPLMMQAWRSLSDEWLRETPPSDNALRDLVGRRDRDALPAFLREWFPHREVEEAVRSRAEHYYHRVRDTPLTAFPDAPALIHALHEREVPVACVSPYYLDLVLFHLQRTGLLDDVPVCVGGDEVEAGPPAPDLLLEAATRLGIEPEQCAVVDDTPVGIQAGHAARMRVVAVAATFPEPVLREAHLVVPTLSALTPELLLDEAAH